MAPAPFVSGGFFYSADRRLQEHPAYVAANEDRSFVASELGRNFSSPGAEYEDPVGNRYRSEHTFQGPSVGTTRLLRQEDGQ